MIKTSKEQIELLEMHKDGIIVAKYWTDLPPKNVLEQKIQEAVMEVYRTIRTTRTKDIKI